MSDNSDFLSGRNLTRGDYNESVDYDTPGNVRSPAANDSSLSGAHGGSGYGQAGGYNSDRKRQQGKQSVADVDYDTPSNVRPQAGDDSSLSGARGGSGYGQAGGYNSDQQRQQGKQGVDDVDYDTPSNVRPRAGDDSSLSGARGGSGYGQAGGYNSDQQRQQGKQSVADVDYDTPSNVRSQAGDNSSLSGAHGGSGYGQTGGYSSGQQRQRGQQSAADDDAGYDPGMAGCGSDDTQDCNVPGAGRLGGERYVPTYTGQSGSLGPGATSYSRGYERDNDEYDPSSDNFATGTQGGKPSLGDRMKGGVEKMAGKVMRDPHLEVKGEQRKTGQF